MPHKNSDLIIQARKVKELILKNNTHIKNIAIIIFSLKEFQNSNSQDFFTPEELLHSKNRLTSLAGRYAAKLAIRGAFKNEIPWRDIGILTSKSGQPVLAGAFADSLKDYNLSFSITHEGDLVAAIAVCTGKNEPIAVGIDAAEISRFEKILTDKPVLKKIFTPHEIEQIKSPKDASFFWSAKEAVSKALGIGIWHGGSLLEIEIGDLINEPKVKLKGSLLKRSDFLRVKSWRINSIFGDKHVFSLVFALRKA